MRAHLLGFLLSAILLPCSQSLGVIAVWHTAVPLTSNASVDAQSSPQDSDLRPLNLRCNKSQGDCSWRITAQLNIHLGTSTGYEIFIRDPAGSLTALSTSGTSISGSPYSNLTSLIENGSNGIIHSIRAAPTAPLPGSTAFHFMHSFVLTKTGADLNGITSLDIGLGCFPGIEPTDPGDPCRFVAVNGSPYSQGGFYYGGFDLITITNVPEPASLSLLACWLVLLGRRKNRRR
jgi:hypothetical protein